MTTVAIEETTSNTTDFKEKNIPSHNIFEKVEGKRIKVGVAFERSNKNGHTLVIGDKKYELFLNKPKPKV
jgi:hypothetical protein